MPFIEKISHEEQKLFTLLFIYYYERENNKKASKTVLLKNIPDMTKGAPASMAEAYLDQILSELVHTGHIEEKAGYRVSDAGISYLEVEGLFVPSEREPTLQRYLPAEELQELLNALGGALNTQVSIMNESGRFWIGSRPITGVCDDCTRGKSPINCMCCDSLAVQRAKERGKLSFNIALEFQDALNAGNVSSGIRKAFEKEGVLLSHNLSVSIKERNTRYLIVDEDNAREYIVRKEEDCFSVRERDVHSYRCHAGFAECVAPIKLNGDNLGYVFLDRIIPDDLDEERLIKYCRDRCTLTIGEKEARSRLREEKRRTRDEIKYIENITDGIATLLSEMISSLDDHVKKIEALDEIVETGAAVLSLEEILKRIMDSAKRISQYDGAAIWRLTRDRLNCMVSDNGLSDSASFEVNDVGFVSWIAREKKSLLISNVFAHIDRDTEPRPKYTEYIKEKRLGSFLGVPLIVEDNLIGVFEIEKHGTGQFTELDRELLMSAARIAGIAIKRSMLLEALDKTFRRKNLSALLDTAARELPPILGAEYCSIYLFDAEREKLFLRASNSPVFRDKINRAYYDEKTTGVTWYVAKNRRITMLKNVRRSKYWRGQYREDINPMGYKSRAYLGCPLKDRFGNVRGVIRFVIRSGGSFFTDRDKQWARNLSTWLSLAMDRIELARAEERSELLLRIAEMQNTAPSIEQLLDGVAEQMAKAFDCQICEIALFDKDKGDLEVRGVYGIGGERKGSRCEVDDRTLTGIVALNRVIIRLSYIRDFYEPELGPRALPRGARLAVPLIYGDELIGVIKLANAHKRRYNPTGEFMPEDETAVRTIAEGIAKAVHDYRLRKSVARISTLSTIDKTYMQERDVNQALDYIVRELDIAIAGCWGSIYRYDLRRNTFARIAFSASDKGGEPPERTDIGHIPAVVAKRDAIYEPDALNSKEHQELLRSDIPDEVRRYILSIGSEYAVPLKVVDRLYGVFCFYKAETDGFDMTNMQAAEDLAARAALLMESHEAVQSLQQLLDARKKLYDAACRLQSTLQLDELLEEVVQSIVDIGYDRARLYLISSDGKRIESAAQRGFKIPENMQRFKNHEVGSDLAGYSPPPKTGSIQVIDGMGILPHTLFLGQPAIYVRKGSASHSEIEYRDIEGITVYVTTGKEVHKKVLEREGVDEWLDLPLIAAGEKLGKIVVDNKWLCRPFSRLDCEILGLFGQYTAQAIRNARDVERTAGFGFGARALAHNIQNRASAISMTLDVLGRGKFDEKTETRMGTIRRANDAILRHVEAMRRAVGLEPVEPREITVGRLIGIVWNELKRSFDAKESNFEVDMPKSVRGKKIEVDIGQSIEVFINLMKNSREAGGEEVRISVSVRSKSGFIYASWQDDGPGIPEENIGNLFKIGYTTRPGGTGTGLYSVKQMLLKNRGDIQFRKTSKNAEGNYIACFVMWLPEKLRESAQPESTDTISAERGGRGHDRS